jgi:hypothetical protein
VVPPFVIPYVDKKRIVLSVTKTLLLGASTANEKALQPMYAQNG